MTLLLGVIGDPINHSLSPLIHNGWLRDNSIPASYEAMQVADGDLPDALQTLATRGARGVNITLPHKHTALRLARTASQRAARIGAANTLSLQPDGGWAADNTDAPGFLQALTSAGFEQLRGQKVTILGAGGSARALVYALHAVGAEILVLNRTLVRARELSEQLGGELSDFGTIDDLDQKTAKASIVINTTSRGHSGEYFQLPDGDDRLFFDISYGRPAQPQLDHAMSRGWRTLDGLSMLVAQAAESFNIWFDIRPDMETALARCRNAVAATL